MKPAKDNNSRNTSTEKAGAGKQDNSGPDAGGSSGGRKEGKRDFRGNRRWRKNRERYRDKDRNRNKERPEDSSREADNREQKKNKVLYKCEICGKDIKDLSSAIASADTQNPVHFDCMLEKLKAENTLENTDKIVYLGSGSFGIVRQEKNKPAKDFTIIRKFEVENRDEKPDWRTGQVKAK